MLFLAAPEGKKAHLLGGGLGEEWNILWFSYKFSFPIA